jgi:hypothetical protein
MNRECTKKRLLYVLETCPIYGRTKKLVKSPRRAISMDFTPKK